MDEKQFLHLGTVHFVQQYFVLVSFFCFEHTRHLFLVIPLDKQWNSSNGGEGFGGAK